MKTSKIGIKTPFQTSKTKNNRNLLETLSKTDENLKYLYKQNKNYYYIRKFNNKTDSKLNLYCHKYLLNL